MKANETNFIALIRQKREEGILYVIDTYGGNEPLFHIVPSRF
jgi:hypothetical protein